MSVKKRVQELNERLADKLVQKGVEANGSETTTQLINKVDEISVGVGADGIYEGDYSVKPFFKQQKLPTKNLLMKEDVTVMEISVTRLSNPSGGISVIIGDV